MKNLVMKLLAWGFAAAVLLASTASAGTVSDMRFGIDAKKRTRIVLETSEKPVYDLGVQQVGDKQQMVLTLKNTNFAIGGTSRQAGTGKGVGDVVGYRYSMSGSSSKVIFGLVGPSVPVKHFSIDKTANKPVYRLVIDMKTVSKQDFAASLPKAPKKVAAATQEIAGKPKSAPKKPTEPLTITKVTPKPATPTPASVTKTEKPSAADIIAERVKRAAEENRQAEQQAEEIKLAVTKVPSRDFVPVPRPKPIIRRASSSSFNRKGIKVVIDAGHGGKDPGAIGKTGLYEKQVTLAAAKELSRQLSKRGYKVLMTRNDDSYIELEDRSIFARDQKADLFISLHADSIKASKVRGASVYTLDDEGDNRFAKMTLSQGNPHIKGVALPADVVGSIVIDVAQFDTSDRSALLAMGIIKELKGRVPMVNNTHRQADLNVLLDPETPAVLLEMGYMSNAMDEANLKSTRWREKTMGLVAKAIDGYYCREESACGTTSYASTAGSAGGN